MHVGIDLGTTFCCMATVGDDQEVIVIPNSEGRLTTPSVICFDGKYAYVGDSANARKLFHPSLIYEFVKRDMGKPVEAVGFEDPMDLTAQNEVRPFEIAGFRYGAAGLSALILRKLKQDAVRYFKKIAKLEKDADEKRVILDAVITVPAYFGDKERQDTKLAGFAAGLNVQKLINEPTAAALTYGLLQKEDERIMVFDLGGGTLDVTLMGMECGKPVVVASDGANTLGGKDWDEVIQRYLVEQFFLQNGRDLPTTGEVAYEVQQKALEAKLELSENTETTVHLAIEEGNLEVTLYRSAPKEDPLNRFDIGPDRPFYFDERSSDLLSRCRTICSMALENARWTWGHVQEIVLAGGSCRMPMIIELLETMSGRKVRQNVVNYDHAIAIGAALHGAHQDRLQDVVSHCMGVRYRSGEGFYVEHLIRKNANLPTGGKQRFAAERNAILLVYEGESERPEECNLRGRLELDNPAGSIEVALEMDTNGVVRALADYSPQGKQVLELRSELFNFSERAEPLQEKIRSVVMK